MTAASALQITEARTLATKPAGARELEIQLITPGWGSSGFYSPEVLERAVTDRVYPAGTQMFADHPTATEDMERPARSIRDLAAITTEDARLDADGGLVARAKPLNGWGGPLAEMKDAIGVSIRAQAMAYEGEAEGRRGPIVERLVEGMSVDFVTKAGRGGKILEVLEAARAAATPVDLPPAVQTARPEQLTVDRQDLRTVVSEAVTRALTPPPVTAGAPPPVPTPETTEESMADTQTGTPPVSAAGPAEVTETTTRVPVSEAARLSRLLEEEHAAHGRALVRADEAEKRADIAEGKLRLLEARWNAETRTKAALATSTLKAASHASVISDVCDGLSLDEDGKVTESAVDAAIKAAIDKESTKVAALLEQHGVGPVSGLGGNTAGNTTQLTEAQADAQLTALFGRLGMDDAGAKLAAKGR